MRRNLLVLMSLLVVSTGVVVVPALTFPASADTVRSADARGDVRTYVSRDGVNTEPKVVDRPSLDLTGFRVTYDRNRIRAVLRYDDLSYSPYVTFWATLYLHHRPPGSDAYDTGSVEVFTSRSRKGGYNYTYFEAFGRTCKANHKIDYDRDEVAISIPSTCVDNLDEILVSVDSWQRATSGSGRFLYDLAPEQGQFALPVARAAS